MKHFQCTLDSDTNTSLELYLFKNVQNVEDIRSNIIQGIWKCAVIKPTLILNPFQVAVAANRAVLSEKSNSLVTKTVYSEILYNLSISKNISQSLSKFGIEKEDSILVCFLSEENREDVLKQIEGEQCDICELSQFTNEKDLKSTYKLNNIKGDCDLLDVIVSRIVTKNFVSF
ncbi:EKC/KEOPS complex subunit TPRKB-like [Aricia agestis]|uniref:EKC/KEOPS complex subunit TPRKB-like n=1 Tax=Aricia agestis TaxID=91739 RepID=UPI001C202E93|nr:EKC/KEOPS complex subunit TPRKB-like [Aricia agestis]